jgi:tripartite ATP-independent transporter DctM subunit
MLFVYLYCRWQGWGKQDGDGKLPIVTAMQDMAALSGAILAFMLGNFVIGTWIGDGKPQQEFDRITDLTGAACFIIYFAVLRAIPKVREALFKRAAFALLMPVIILGGIYGGVFTPTEASVAAVFYGLIVGMFIYREVRPKDLLPVLKRSVISSAVIMFIIANAGVFAWLIDRAGVPEQIGLWLKATLQSPELFLLGVNVALFIIGMFIETSASIIVLAPILVPVAIYFGIDPVHFGMIMVVNLALGMITPPFGVNLFAACTVAKISLDQIVTRLLPFVAVILACLMVITYFPPLSLTLRDLVYR